MMRFLRKGDRYALSTPIKNRYYLFLNSFQCLLLSLSTIYYQFSCNVQESRARGTTGYGVERAGSIKKRLSTMSPSGLRHDVRNDGRKGSDGRRSAAVLSTIFCVLFSFASAMEALAQEPRQGGATAATAYNFENFENTTFKFPVTYTYYYDQRNYEHTLKVDPKADLIRFPLISYSLDFAASPKIALDEKIPGSMLKLPFRYVDSTGSIIEATLEQFSESKLLILDFWATWCSPCVKSMNKWNEIAAEVEGVEVLGIMLDYDYKAQYYGVDKGWASPIVFGPQAYMLTSFFFDRPVISRMAWIKDGRLIAFTGTKGYDLQLVKDVLAGRDAEIPMNLDYTYTTDKS